MLLDKEIRAEFEAMWGLDGKGEFMRDSIDMPQTAGSERKSLISNIISKRSTSKPPIQSLIRGEISTVLLSLQREQLRFDEELQNDGERSKRLLFLFQNLT